MRGPPERKTFLVMAVDAKRGWWQVPGPTRTKKTMAETTYEDLSNYDTWTIKLWINRAAYSHEYWERQALTHWLAAALCSDVNDGKETRRNTACRALVQQLKNEIPGSFPVKSPVCAGCPHATHDEVEWPELAEYLLTDALMPRERTDDLSGPAMSSYATRAQAFDDGFLINVSKMAKEAGITHPTAVTEVVWNEFVEDPWGVTVQNQRGRLWDILTMFRSAAKQAPQSEELLFHVLVRNDNQAPQLVTFKAICKPGDTPESVLTIMLPDEE